jgi:hypothetical protein
MHAPVVCLKPHRCLSRCSQSQCDLRTSPYTLCSGSFDATRRLVRCSFFPPCPLVLVARVSRATDDTTHVLVSGFLYLECGLAALALKSLIMNNEEPLFLSVVTSFKVVKSPQAVGSRLSLLDQGRGLRASRRPSATQDGEVNP